MKSSWRYFNSAVCSALLLAGLVTSSVAADLTPAQKASVDKKIEEIKTWAADQAIVKAVKDQNSAPTADVTGLDQKKWDALTVMDPAIRGFSKGAAAEVLKSKKGEVVSEAFLSDSEGRKVAFLAKTSSWSHKGKGKHDEPMAGKVWIGKVEVDASSGVQQLQVAVPVLDGSKAIGSLVVGLSVTKLQ